MALPGPLPVVPQQPLHSQDVRLRVNQRITAEIVEISGVRAVLSVEGYPVVARLESSEQGARLNGQKLGHFIVTSLTGNEVVLKIVDGKSTTPTTPTITADIAARILSDLGLEATSENLLLARALLSQGLQISEEMVEELRGFLQDSGKWGDAQAQLAAAIRAAGLPLTEGTFQLAAAQRAATGAALQDLVKALQNALANPRLAPELRAALQATLSQLLENAPTFGTDARNLADALHNTANMLGRPFENILSSQSQEALPNHLLLNLAHLRGQAAEAGERTLANQLSTVLQNLQQNHINNLRLNPVPGQGDWCELGFVMRAQPPHENDVLPVRLRVARRESSRGRPIDPNNTRMVVQVDLGNGQSVQVDVALAGKRVRTDVTASDDDLCRRSEEELPSLQTALNQMGYQLSAAHIQLGKVQPVPIVQVSPADDTHLHGINVKI